MSRLERLLEEVRGCPIMEDSAGNWQISKIERELEAHGKTTPGRTPVEKAMWYFRLGELWGMYYTRTGKGAGSAGHAYNKAAKWFKESEGLCRFLAEKAFNRIGK